MEHFVSTPSSSDVDLLIEKFRVEVSNSINDRNADTRKLTLSSTIKPRTSEVSNNIDRQITELENLIKKLQDEITQMTQNADKEVENYTPIESNEIRRDVSNETIILDNEYDNIQETKSVRDSMKGKNSNECFASEQYSHVFPLMVRDVIIPLNSGFKTLGHAVTDILTKDTEEKTPEKMITIKQDIIDVRDDLPDYAPKDNLEELIDELQAEISEKMDTLKDNNIEESCDKFEDA